MNEVDKKNNDFSTVLDKYIKKNKVNHAYLIETNSPNRIDLAKKLIKKILSFENKTSIDDLETNNDLQIIKTEQQNIKKEEIISLKEKFKTKSIYNSKRIYVIEEAEKLNTSSANTLLKFLEEPEEDIIAILLTSNRNIVINTIVSRCQIIRYYIPEGMENDLSDEYIENLFSFICTVEEKKEKAIAYINKFYTKEMSDRTSLKEFLTNILYAYSDVLHYKVGVELDYFPMKKEEIKKISDFNQIIDIKNKINAVNICINRLKYNPNIKLLLDKLVILMSGVDINV